MLVNAEVQKNKLLVICGISGSGKSTLEQNLILEYPELFHKWQQVSSRKPRDYERMGDPYVFVERSTFLHMKDVLVGRLGLKENSLFKDYYGSIPDFVEGKISTVILAEEAILDIKEELAKGNLNIDELFILGLSVAYEDLNEKDLRENRDKDFLNKELSVLRYANFVFNPNENGKYIAPKEVIKILSDNKFL
jgi:guanylate kinase